MSGSPKSSVITSGFRLLAIKTPSAPPLATVTSNPAWVSTVRTSSRMSWSSSMTRPTRASLIEPPQCQRQKYSWLRISCWYGLEHPDFHVYRTMSAPTAWSSGRLRFFKRPFHEYRLTDRVALSQMPLFVTTLLTAFLVWAFFPDTMDDP